MDFKSWLDKENVSQQQVAKDLDISQVAVCYYVNGQKIPRPETMAKIIAYTKGEVTANDFYNVESKNE